MTNLATIHLKNAISAAPFQTAADAKRCVEVIAKHNTADEASFAIQFFNEMKTILTDADLISAANEIASICY